MFRYLAYFMIAVVLASLVLGYLSYANVSFAVDAVSYISSSLSKLFRWLGVDKEPLYKISVPSGCSVAGGGYFCKGYVTFNIVVNTSDVDVAIWVDGNATILTPDCSYCSYDILFRDNQKMLVHVAPTMKTGGAPWIVKEVIEVYGSLSVTINGSSDGYYVYIYVRPHV